jgi:hypothetical protein
MDPGLIRTLITAGLLLHGVAHGRAFLALLIEAVWSRDRTPVPVHLWIWPSLSHRAAVLIASPFYLVSAVGFILAALAFWGVVPFSGAWRQMALLSSVVSVVGVVLSSGVWPGAPSRRFSMLDTSIGLVVDAAVIVLLLVVGWPPVSMYGK